MWHHAPEASISSLASIQRSAALGALSLRPPVAERWRHHWPPREPLAPQYRQELLPEPQPALAQDQQPPHPLLREDAARPRVSACGGTRGGRARKKGPFLCVLMRSPSSHPAVVWAHPRSKGPVQRACVKTGHPAYSNPKAYRMNHTLQGRGPWQNNAHERNILGERTPLGADTLQNS